MTMNGTPAVFGSGMDSNNLLDVRDALGRNNQGTIRVDRTFGNSDTLNVRFSSSNEQGFTPQNLPGYGFNFDNASQNGSIIWTRILSPAIVNTASVGVSRLAMFHWSQNNGVNDIVDALGITGTNFGGPAAWGAPYFNVQGYSPFGDAWQATPMHQWSTTFEGRETLSLAEGPPQPQVRRSYRKVIWPMWALVQSRGYYQFTPGFTTQTATNDGTGSALASFLLGDPASRQLQAGVPSMNLRNWSVDAFAQDTWRVTPSTTIDAACATNSKRRWWTSSATGATSCRRTASWWPSSAVRMACRAACMYPPKLRFAPRLGVAHHFQAERPRLPRRVRDLLYAGGYEHLVQPVAQRAHSVPHHPAERQLHSADRRIQLPAARARHTVVSFTGFDPHARRRSTCSSGADRSRRAWDTMRRWKPAITASAGSTCNKRCLINNALPGPGAIQPRRPYATATFMPPAPCCPSTASRCRAPRSPSAP
jgi:hypothetical protein